MCCFFATGEVKLSGRLKYQSTIVDPSGPAPASSSGKAVLRCPAWAAGASSSGGAARMDHNSRRSAAHLRGRPPQNLGDQPEMQETDFL
ncbi:MAG: hypothetical protein E2O78_05510 [Caldithrix sp.]|nr:MAG: hypothetical protein E2O78_05510 [Caldithrix sp.]